MKFIFLFLLSFNLAAQKKFVIPSDAKHFYASFCINEFSYQVQDLMLPKQKIHNRILISNAVTVIAGFSKEQFDKTRCNRNKRTGFSWDDIFVDLWSIPVYDIYRICLNDLKKENEFQRKKYIFN
jgi:hypothetical protein